MPFVTCLVNGQLQEYKHLCIFFNTAVLFPGPQPISIILVGLAREILLTKSTADCVLSFLYFKYGNESQSFIVISP